jgi:hypothetical protein
MWQRQWRWPSPPPRSCTRTRTRHELSSPPAGCGSPFSISGNSVPQVKVAAPTPPKEPVLRLSVRTTHLKPPTPRCTRCETSCRQRQSESQAINHCTPLQCNLKPDLPTTCPSLRHLSSVYHFTSLLLPLLTLTSHFCRQFCPTPPSNPPRSRLSVKKDTEIAGNPRPLSHCTAFLPSLYPTCRPLFTPPLRSASEERSRDVVEVNQEYVK